MFGYAFSLQYCKINVSVGADVHVVYSWVRVTSETSGYLILKNVHEVVYEYRVKFFVIF